MINWKLDSSYYECFIAAPNRIRIGSEHKITVEKSALEYPANIGLDRNVPMLNYETIDNAEVKYIQPPR